jgi:hypothetical protein
MSFLLFIFSSVKKAILSISLFCFRYYIYLFYYHSVISLCLRYSFIVFLYLFYYILLIPRHYIPSLFRQYFLIFSFFYYIIMPLSTYTSTYYIPYPYTNYHYYADNMCWSWQWHSIQPTSYTDTETNYYCHYVIHLLNSSKL